MAAMPGCALVQVYARSPTGEGEPVATRRTARPMGICSGVAGLCSAAKATTAGVPRSVVITTVLAPSRCSTAPAERIAPTRAIDRRGQLVLHRLGAALAEHLVGTKAAHAVGVAGEAHQVHGSARRLRRPDRLGQRRDRHAVLGGGRGAAEYEALEHRRGLAAEEREIGWPPLVGGLGTEPRLGRHRAAARGDAVERARQEPPVVAQALLPLESLQRAAVCASSTPSTTSDAEARRLSACCSHQIVAIAPTRRCADARSRPSHPSTGTTSQDPCYSILTARFAPAQTRAQVET